MTGAHNLFHLCARVICDHCPPARGNVEDFDFMSAVPYNNHNTVGTACWQNQDSSPPQFAIILHCHVCLCLSNTYISSESWRQCTSKITAHYQAIPVLLRGLGEAVVTDDWCIMYSLICTSHENLVLSHPSPSKNILTTNTKYDIR